MTTPTGWHCPSCDRCHAPHVQTCPLDVCEPRHCEPEPECPVLDDLVRWHASMADCTTPDEHAARCEGFREGIAAARRERDTGESYDPVAFRRGFALGRARATGWQAGYDAERARCG